MWSPGIAHWFHLKKDDMLDVSLSEFVAMIDYAKQD